MNHELLKHSKNKKGACFPINKDSDSLEQVDPNPPPGGTGRPLQFLDGTNLRCAAGLEARTASAKRLACPLQQFNSSLCVTLFCMVALFVGSHRRTWIWKFVTACEPDLCFRSQRSQNVFQQLSPGNAKLQWAALLCSSVLDRWPAVQPHLENPHYSRVSLFEVCARQKKRHLTLNWPRKREWNICALF